MTALLAALFATSGNNQNKQDSLRAHAVLTGGDSPCWEIHIKDKIFRFIPDSDHLIEDGLWQLVLYCLIPENEYAYDVHYNTPQTLEEEFGKKSCEEARRKLSGEIKKAGVQITMTTWPSIDKEKLSRSLDQLKHSGVSLMHQHLGFN